MVIKDEIIIVHCDEIKKKLVYWADILRIWCYSKYKIKNVFTKKKKLSFKNGFN